MCAMQHEPPRVPLTARSNPRPALGMEPTSAGHPGMGHPTVPTASPAFGGCRASLMHLQQRGASPVWPRQDRQLPVLPGRAVFGLSGCGTAGSTNPFPAPQHQPGCS